MSMLTGERMRRSARAKCLAIIILAATAACGKGEAPTGPSAQPQVRPLPDIQMTVTPNPAVASVQSIDGAAGSVTFRVQATVIFRETAGMGGRLTKLTGVVTRSVGGDTPGDLAIDLPFAAFGSASGTYFHDFVVAAPADLRWKLSAAGIDELGRPFSTVVADVDIVSAHTNPPAAGSGRLELWGGRDHAEYLGCFSCNEFDSESVFNQFGRYGSRFSSTSIWNQFSQYGSAFSQYSVCNEFANNPPRLVNVQARTYVELTLNEFRPYVFKASIPWLRAEVCR